MNKLRRKILITIASVLAGLYILYSCRCCALFIYGSLIGTPDFHYFGEKTYSELLLPCTPIDRILLTPCISKVDEAMSAIEPPSRTYEEQKADWGALSSYVNDRPNTAYEEHTISFLTGRVIGDTAYIWIIYDSTAYDKNDKRIGGSWDILARIEFQYENGEWLAVDNNEPP